MRRLSITFLLIHATLAGAASLRASDVYRAPAGIRDGLSVWIVDGGAVRREIYPEFLYGGNGERYLFVPPRELWIDHAITVEEFQYTLAHEAHERMLMATRGLTYADAHDSSLALERTLRRADALASRAHEFAIGAVSPTDCDGVKEIAALPDSIGLSNIYRVDAGMHDSIHVWIVDGAVVRRDIFPDFGFSGNDLAYHFIPAKEIWIDNAMSCEELDFAVAEELDEREKMAEGRSYDEAYEIALTATRSKRRAAHRRAATHAVLHVGTTLDRDVGTNSEHAPTP